MVDNNSNYSSNINILCWNIQNIKSKANNKLIDDIFLYNIEGHQILGFTETHSLNSETLYIPGYDTPFRGCRPTKEDKGGIAIFIHNSIKKGVSYKKSKSVDLIWCILDKGFFSFRRDVYIGLFYASPVGSNWHNKSGTDPYVILEADVATYKFKGDIILMGDFNARTSIRSELSRFNLSQSIQYIGPRSSEDNVYKDAQDLIEICKAADLIICNGRVTGDINGKLTCHKYNGSSVVDYFITDINIFNLVRFMEVCPLNVLSDHCPITMSLSCNYDSDTSEYPKIETNFIPKKPKWDESFKIKFKSSFLNKDLKEMMETASKTNISDCDKFLDNINNIYHLASGIVTNMHKRPFKKKRRKQKPWFNDNCKQFKRETNKAARLLSKSPNDINVRSSYFKMLNEYKRCLKRTKADFKSKLIDELNSNLNKDPKEFWNTLKELNSIDNDDDNSNASISIEEWDNHYRKLFNSRDDDMSTLPPS